MRTKADKITDVISSVIAVLGIFVLWRFETNTVNIAVAFTCYALSLMFSNFEDRRVTRILEQFGCIASMLGLLILPQILLWQIFWILFVVIVNLHVEIKSFTKNVSELFGLIEKVDEERLKKKWSD